MDKFAKLGNPRDKKSQDVDVYLKIASKDILKKIVTKIHNISSKN